MDVKALTPELSVAPQTVAAATSAVVQADIELKGVVRRIVNGGTPTGREWMAQPEMTT